MSQPPEIAELIALDNGTALLHSGPCAYKGPPCFCGADRRRSALTAVRAKRWVEAVPDEEREHLARVVDEWREQGRPPRSKGTLRRIAAALRAGPRAKVEMKLALSPDPLTPEWDRGYRFALGHVRVLVDDASRTLECGCEHNARTLATMVRDGRHGHGHYAQDGDYMGPCTSRAAGLGAEGVAGSSEDRSSSPRNPGAQPGALGPECVGDGWHQACDVKDCGCSCHEDQRARQQPGAAGDAELIAEWRRRATMLRLDSPEPTLDGSTAALGDALATALAERGRELSAAERYGDEQRQRAKVAEAEVERLRAQLAASHGRQT